MSTKLQSFLTENKIDPRRLLSASQKIENLRPEDRTIRAAQRRARRSEDGKKPEGLKKPRSGRPVTGIGLETALGGGTVAGPIKTRILRAVNRILEQRKLAAVTLDKLF
ncbi:MAG: hypothetical protein IT373_13850 [Polyangiaceae bacterium]|nr:hypothetical protein [Polyangiaceae bacterium]